MAVAARPAPTGYVVLGAAPHPVALAAGPPQPAAARAEPPHTAPTAPGPDAAAGSAELVGLAPAAHGVVADAGQAFRGLTSAEPSACSAIVSLQASGTTAGAHHYPTGDRLAGGLVTGAAAGCLWHGGCFWGAGCGIIGMLLQREYLKQGAIVSMPAGDGIVFALTTEEVRVKLWSAGRTAPLTQDGFALVATDRRVEQMQRFMYRVVAALGGRVENVRAFSDFFVPRCHGTDTTPSRWKQCTGVRRGGKPIPNLSEAVAELQEEEVSNGVRFRGGLQNNGRR